MKQTKMVSLIEAIVNTAIGFVIAFALWPAVAYLVGYDYSTGTNLLITSIFTVSSLIRGYAIRRWFNGGLHSFATTIATGLFNQSTKES
jgi:hypothetical protein